MAKAQIDTRKKLRDKMDELAVVLAEQLEKLGPQRFDDKLAGFATLTKYITAVNREPEQPEGADLGEFRKRLDRFSVVGGSGAGSGDGDGDLDDDDDAAGTGGESDAAADEAAAGGDDAADDPDTRAA